MTICPVILNDEFYFTSLYTALFLHCNQVEFNILPYLK